MHETLGLFTDWLSLHTSIAYGVLFLGSYFETFIATCFLIPGEIFFIAGSALAGAHVLSLPLVLLTLFGGAILGDTSSFFIGKRFGPSFFKEGRRVLSLENYRKGEQLFAKHGAKALFFCRFLGPLSWVTPFLAGMYRVPYRTFAVYNTLGVIVGISQFIVLGYVLGTQYEKIAPWFFVRPFTFTFVIVVFVVLIGWRLSHFRKKSKMKSKSPEIEAE